MSGIAIKVPGADFSDSPLGRVTFIKSIQELAEEVVEIYLNKIGNNQYKSQLVSMVASLMSEGVWEGIDIYPMLGSTLTHKTYNININDGLQKCDLIFGSNASNVENGVAFVQGDNYGSTIANEQYKVIQGTPEVVAPALNGFYLLADYKRDATGNIRPLYETRGTSITSFIVKSGSTGKFSINISQTQLTGNIVLGTSRNICSAGVSNGYLTSYINGAQDATTELVLSNNPNVQLGNFLGASPYSDAAATTFNGTCRFWAIGITDSSKHAVLNTIFKTFLNEVKPNS